MSDLVQRLREQGWRKAAQPRLTQQFPNPIEHEAADEIERLTREKAAERGLREGAVLALEAERDRLTRENKRLQGLFDNAVMVIGTNARLRAALEEYGCHTNSSCGDGVCVCGLSEALTSVREATAEGVLRGEK